MAEIVPAELQNFELFAGFQPAELEQIAAQLTLREFAAGDVVFSAGDESRSLYLIIGGKVQIELIGRLVDETELAELGPCEVFGESTFFHAARHNATARCVEASRLAELPYATYEAMLRDASSVAYHLGANAAHILAARLQSTDQWIRELLDYDEQMRRRELRTRYYTTFRPSFSTPHGYVGLGVRWGSE